MDRRAVRAGVRGLRAADSDRDRVIDLLADAVADGRLTIDEHSQRVDQAQSARTLGELADITADLAAPGDQPLRLDGRMVNAILRRDYRGGRWVVPDGFTATAVLGGLYLDLTSALLQSQRLSMRLGTVLGTVRLLVPEGVRVELTRTSLAGRQPARVLVPGRPDGPVIDIRAFCALGDIQAMVPRRRSWLAALGLGSGRVRRW